MRLTRGWAILTVAVFLGGIYTLFRFSQGTVLGTTGPQLTTIPLALSDNERLEGAAGGYLANTQWPALVFGTNLQFEDRGRLHVLHWTGNRYEEVWSYTSDHGRFDQAIVQGVGGGSPDKLITLWRAGQGGYLDVRIFSWDGRTYREIWNLEQFFAGGQLIRAATFQTRRFDEAGNVEIVIRAPNVPPGDSAAVPHQVSIYRLDAQKRTFVLFKRFVDPNKTFE